MKKAAAHGFLLVALLPALLLWAAVGCGGAKGAKGSKGANGRNGPSRGNSPLRLQQSTARSPRHRRRWHSGLRQQAWRRSWHPHSPRAAGGLDVRPGDSSLNPRVEKPFKVWGYDAPQLEAFRITTVIGDGYPLELRWNEDRPKSKAITLVARYSSRGKKRFIPPRSPSPCSRGSSKLHLTRNTA